MQDKKANPLSTGNARRGFKKSEHDYSTSVASQRQRVLSRFFSSENRLTVKEGRDLLGVMHLPARIFELRKMGHRIITQWVYESDCYGMRHRNGLYIYMGKQGGKRYAK